MPHRARLATRAFLKWICQGVHVPSEAVTSSTHGALSGRRVLLVLAAIVLVALAILIVVFKTRPPDPELGDLATVPSFSLVDERTQPFTDDALRRQVTIVAFIFTRCPDICPLTSARMEHLQEQLFDIGDRVKLLSISIDPSYDTPERLAEYAQRFHADPTRWRFITGPADKVHSLVENGFLTAIELQGDQNGVPKIAHRGYFMLVDPTLHVRGKYEQNDAELGNLVRDARFLARTML
jgi:protein SCO1/2